MDREMTRRGLGRKMGAVLAAGASVAASAAQTNQVITAAQVIDRIKKKLVQEGIPWSPSFFDVFHLGDPNTPVTGIATTFQSTFSVLQRAAAAHKNLIISHECTFWDSWMDDPILAMPEMLNDPVCKAKIQFAEQHNLVVWRIHDHWHRRRPDPIFSGLARQLDWTGYYNMDSQPRHYTIPETSLEEVARHIQRKLGAQNVVVIGDPKLRVTTVGDCVHVLATVLPALHSCDIALVGETPQYDTFEYVRDAMNLGLKKGLVMISHEALEEWGMQVCAEWLKPFVPEVPIEWIPAGDPFQIPPLH